MNGCSWLLAEFWTPGVATWQFLLPELLLVGTIAGILVATVMAGRDARVTGLIALLGCAGAALAAWHSLGLLAGGPVELGGVPDDAGGFGPGMLAIDRFGLCFRLFVLVFLVAIIGLWFLFDAARERHAAEFFVLLIASAIGMSLMSSAVNLLTMVIAIEIASMPSFALAAFDRFRRSAAEAGVKYVLFGATTSGFMIYGISLLYGLFGTLHIPTLVDRLATAAQWGLPSAELWLIAFALLTLLAGVGFKISAVPFHFWCPDVFEGASLPVATWLSVASKAAGLVLLLRLVGMFVVPQRGEYEITILPLVSYGVGLLAMATCTIANLAAYQQTNVRRLLAYSSIAHAGYMLCAGAILFRGEAPASAALSALAAYLAIYLFMNLGAFTTLGLVAADTGREDLDAFTGLGWRDPTVAASMTVCLISLVGLPPLGGFIVKFWLLCALGDAASSAETGVLVAAQSTLLWLLVGVVVINTAISLFYYARIIRQMFLRGIETRDGALRAPALGKLAVHVCALVLLLTGTLLIPALKRTADAAATGAYTAAAPIAPARVVQSAP